MEEKNYKIYDSLYNVMSLKTTSQFDHIEADTIGNNLLIIKRTADEMFENVSYELSLYDISTQKEISNLKATTDSLKSVTVGINLNDRFEADGGDFTGGFATEGLCDFPTSSYCYSDGSGTLPSIFVS